MNLSQLEASFRVDADDAVKPYLWSSDEVIGWFNEAEEEACLRANLIPEKEDPAICQIAVSQADGSVYRLHELIHEIEYVSLTDAAGVRYRLDITDRHELDRIRPNWRTESRRPTGIIRYDTKLELDSVVDGSYTLNIEVFRLPRRPMAAEKDCPEINRIHHKHLVQWVLHRAYEKPDSETLNPEKSARALAKFEEYFGTRPDANQRRNENANLPHRTKAYW